MKMTTIERFLDKIDTSGECWIWTGRKNAKGYGSFGVSHGVSVRAHRWAWEHFNGPIPEGMNVCHKCDNPSCVRLNHLFLGTQSENMKDAVAKGRNFNPMLAGIQHGNSKKTHCKNGHEYTLENTYRSRGERQCRTCRATSRKKRTDKA